ncbi:MAG: hypothetical protein ABFQ95_02795 [Pseudomonadota bacterium]
MMQKQYFNIKKLTLTLLLGISLITVGIYEISATDTPEDLEVMVRNFKTSQLDLVKFRKDDPFSEFKNKIGRKVNLKTDEFKLVRFGKEFDNKAYTEMNKLFFASKGDLYLLQNE